MKQATPSSKKTRITSPLIAVPAPSAAQSSILERCEAYNHGRIPHLVQQKYKKMSENVFSFFRGTCHLFYEDWSLESTFKAPPVWICGDLHTENFGSYKGANRLVYFDINDFDEAVLAPASLEITRLVTSIFVAAEAYSLSQDDAHALAHIILDSYAASLQYGKAGAVERESAHGIVANLLHAAQYRTRKEFLDERSDVKKRTRNINANEKRYFEIEQEQENIIATHIEEFGKKNNMTDFFKVLDVKRRIAGTGSLGVERFAILVEGNGSPNKNYLLDFKEALPSSLVMVKNQAVGLQPEWAHEAFRVVELQHRMQFQTPALLSALEMAGKTYILRELQPSQDKLDLAALKGKYKRFSTALATMGKLTAFAQLRSSGRQGSATIDSLIEFASQTAWQQDIVHYAASYSRQVHNDYTTFCQEHTKSLTA
ncbi:MAG: DUF2252 domain-containing protein [Candidatus Kapaibacterium sp.]|nr:MAG: DUF2252 domain-containing protein [Candidatus Kapabacteria bacterium]